MTKKIELFFGALLVPLDYITLLVAAYLAYVIRFGDSVIGLRPVIYELPFRDYFPVVALFALVELLIFAGVGLYNLSSTRRIIDELRHIFIGSSIAVLLIIILVFFDRELFSSRFIILLSYALTVTLLFLERFTVIQIERQFFKHGYGVRRLVLVGDNRTAQTLLQAINGNPVFGMRIVERVKAFDDSFFSKLSKITQVKSIDEVLLSDPTISRLDTTRLIEFCKAHHLDFKYAADIFDSQSSHVLIRPFAGIPIVEIQRTPLQGWGSILKRCIDIIGSSVALVVLSPVMILAALAIRLESTGPAIYRNQRVGQNGKKFDTLKFRSMYQKYCIGTDAVASAEALAYEQKLIAEKSIKTGPIYKIKDDPRVTKVGRFIRATSIDELPQFINVLLGTMSLVGPRPHQPREVDQYEEHHHAILTMKPGISGLPQISGRSDLEFDEEARLDTYYMENWSLWLDLYILFKTPFVLFRKRKAL